MQRKEISLSRDTVLWEEGDAARDIAVVAKGKLAARTAKGLVGIVLPNMVLGETALFLEGAGVRRTATIYALEDETLVTAYPASEVKLAFEGGDDSVMRQVLANLVGQVSRNLMMVISSRRGYSYLDDPLTGLLKGLLRDAQEKPPISSWSTLLGTCRYLHDLRELSDRLVDQFGPDPAGRSDALANASDLIAQFSEGRDIRSLVETFLNAEVEKSQWWLRGGGA